MRLTKLSFMQSLIVLLMVVLPASLPAQGEMSVGVKFGASASSFRGTDEARFAISTSERQDFFDKRITATGGFFFSFPLTGQLFFQPELNFALKGARQKIAVPELGDLEITYKLNYLQLPLLMRVELNQGEDNNALGIFGGPAINLLSRYDVDVVDTIEGRDIQGDRNRDDFNLIEDTDIGLIFGLDFIFSSHIIADFRYELGLQRFVADMRRVGDGVEEMDVDLKNGMFSMSLGLRL